jgi:hypothetical protein
MSAIAEQSHRSSARLAEQSHRDRVKRPVSYREAAVYPPLDIDEPLRTFRETARPSVEPNKRSALRRWARKAQMRLRLLGWRLDRQRRRGLRFFQIIDVGGDAAGHS